MVIQNKNGGFDLSLRIGAFCFLFNKSYNVPQIILKYIRPSKFIEFFSVEHVGITLNSEPLLEYFLKLEFGFFKHFMGKFFISTLHWFNHLVVCKRETEFLRNKETDDRTICLSLAYEFHLTFNSL